MTTFDLDQTDRLLTTTRAVRQRLDLERPVERDVVLDCIRIGLQAPTGGNRQGWRWLVVDDPDVRARLADIYRRGSEAYFARRRAEVAQGGGPQEATVLRSALYLNDHLQEVPIHVVPCLLERLPEGASNESAAGFYASIVPAVWSFMLALRSRGLGSAYTTLHLNYEEEAAALLDIPKTATQVALIPVAYYTGADFRPGPRHPVEEVTYFNGWERRVGESS